MKAYERRKKMLSLINDMKFVSMQDLKNYLNVSEATIRRDLADLDANGKVIRTHGGASSIFVDYTYDGNFLPDVMSVEKRQIAEKAFNLIKENDSIVLDSGTTALELAKLIGESSKSLFVITNYTMSINYLAKNKNCQVFVIGGNLNNNTMAPSGTFAEEAYNQFHVNKAFLGANGVSLYYGITASKIHVAKVKESMMKIAGESILLADHSKFEKVSLCRFAPIERISKIICDDGLDDVLYEKYKQYIYIPKEN